MRIPTKSQRTGLVKISRNSVGTDLIIGLEGVLKNAGSVAVCFAAICFS